MHHNECLAPNVDINLQSERFWATSIASFRERFADFRSCWVVFIHLVQGRPGGLLKFSKGEADKICLASFSASIRTTWAEQDEMPCLNGSGKMRFNYIFCNYSHTTLPDHWAMLNDSNKQSISWCEWWHVMSAQSHLIQSKPHFITLCEYSFKTLQHILLL